MQRAPSPPRVAPEPFGFAPAAAPAVLPSVFASDPPAAAPPQEGLLLTRQGWRAQDWLERAILDELRALGPWRGAAGLAVYAGFPWSALIDSLARPASLEARFLETARQLLRLRRPVGRALVTSCQHPAVLAHLELLVEAGVSDLFCPAAPPEGQRQIQGLRLHPLPALPDPRAPAPLPFGGPAPPGPDGRAARLQVWPCPGRDFGNTPELWRAVQAGAVPLLPAGRPLSLPGPEALWRAALLRGGAEDDDGGDGLARQAALAAQWEAKLNADPAVAAARRAALAGLGLLHRPGHLAIAVLARLQALSGPEAAGPASRPAPPLGGPQGPGQFAAFGSQWPAPRALTRAAAEALHHAAAEDLLRGHPAALGRLRGVEAAAAEALLARARALLPPHNPAVLRLAALRAAPQTAPAPPNGPGAAALPEAPTPGPAPHGPVPPGPVPVPRPRRGALRVHLLGPRGQRCPLAYAPLQAAMAGRIDLVAEPDQAELLVTGWSRDFQDQGALLGRLWAAGHRPRLVVLSEEPLWDSLWSGGPGGRDRWLEQDGRRYGYRVLNHVTSAVFAFAHLPWFVLSEAHYTARQARLIAGFAALTPRALLAHWRAAPLQAAFIAERRPGADYAAAHPLEAVWGLSRYRSRVAELTPGAAVLRLGQGWPDPDLPPAPDRPTPPRRQTLPDWHLDKLARLHGRVRVVAAYENTLQRDYISEKPFDAFASGALAAVAAPPDHRLLTLVPPEAVLNTCADPPALAAARIAAWRPDLAQAVAWREAAWGLVHRLGDLRALRDERQRLLEAVLAELQLALAEPPEPP